MTARIKIIETANVQGRSDLLAVVEFEQGPLVPGCDEYIRVGSKEIWRITVIANVLPYVVEDTGNNRLVIGLEPHSSDSRLAPGDVLERIESESVR